jgi:DNA-binding IclR family transcriptional regulator
VASRIDAPLGLDVAAHAASCFLLGLLGVVSGGLDLIDTILLLAALQANVAQVSADRGLQIRYSALQAVPPDDLRRPISVTALAASLALPFETVRRRLASLEQAGLCEVSGRGYRIPSRVLEEERFARAPREIDGLLRGLHRRLSAAGCLDGLPPPQDPAASFDHPPVRISARLGSDYFLRMLALVTERAGDPVDGFLLLAVFSENVGSAPSSPADAGSWLQPRPADDQLRPVRAAAVAQGLALSSETARRRLLSLEARGLCARTRGGWILPADSLAALRFEEVMSENLTNLRQMFSGLTRMGVLSYWGREAA